MPQKTNTTASRGLVQDYYAQAVKYRDRYNQAVKYHQLLQKHAPALQNVDIDQQSLVKLLTDLGEVHKMPAELWQSATPPLAAYIKRILDGSASKLPVSVIGDGIYDIIKSQAPSDPGISRAAVTQNVRNIVDQVVGLRDTSRHLADVQQRWGATTGEQYGSLGEEAAQAYAAAMGGVYNAADTLRSQMQQLSTSLKGVNPQAISAPHTGMAAVGSAARHIVNDAVDGTRQLFNRSSTDAPAAETPSSKNQTGALVGDVITVGSSLPATLRGDLARLVLPIIARAAGKTAVKKGARATMARVGKISEGLAGVITRSMPTAASPTVTAGRMLPVKAKTVSALTRLSKVKGGKAWWQVPLMGAMVDIAGTLKNPEAAAAARDALLQDQREKMPSATSKLAPALSAYQALPYRAWLSPIQHARAFGTSPSRYLKARAGDIAMAYDSGASNLAGHGVRPLGKRLFGEVPTETRP